jgi:hypothetical protein
MEVIEVEAMEAAVSAVNLTKYRALCKTILYAIIPQNVLIRSDVIYPNTKIACSFESISLEGPSANGRAQCGPAQFVAYITDSGLSGLDTGSVAANTTYYIWLVGHDENSDGLADQCGLLISLSNTSPTMPIVNGTTLDYKRLVSVLFTDSSGYIIPFVHDNGNYTFSEKQLVETINASTTTTVDLNDYTPAGGRIAYLTVATESTSGTVDIDIQTYHGNTLFNMDARSGHNSSVQIIVPDILDDPDRKVVIVSTLTTAVIYVYIDGFLMRLEEP